MKNALFFRINPGATFIFLFLSILITLSVSCSKSSDDSTTPTNTIDPALVGTWKGTGTGTDVNSIAVTLDLTVVLQSDGRFTSSGTRAGVSCGVDGTWKVAGTAFSAQGLFGTGCTDHGTLFLNAPRSTTVLSGNWSEKLASGTFTITKQ